MAETTKLSPLEEILFNKWVQEQQIQDVDAPESFYDYRGFWKTGESHVPGDHFPDTFKQHGHPTFSRESKYSRGPNDGGRWSGETYLPQLATSRSSVDPNQLSSSLLELLRPK